MHCVIIVATTDLEMFGYDWHSVVVTQKVGQAAQHRLCHEREAIAETSETITTKVTMHRCFICLSVTSCH